MRGILKNFIIFIGKHLCSSLFLIWLFSLNIAKFLRTPIWKNVCGQLLLFLTSVLSVKDSLATFFNLSGKLGSL